METTHTTQTSRLHLSRPHEGRVLGGVASAIADHTGASVGLIRLGFLVGALFGGFGVVLYAAAWALIPSVDQDESAAERWLRNLTTPGKRAGAFLIGVAGLIVLAGAAPATILAAVALMAAAAFLATDRQPDPITAAEASSAPTTTQETE